MPLPLELSLSNGMVHQLLDGPGRDSGSARGVIAESAGDEVCANFLNVSLLEL